MLQTIEVGCDIVDEAVSSMSAVSATNAVIASSKTSGASSVPLQKLDEVSRYWEEYPQKYQAFDRDSKPHPQMFTAKNFRRSVFEPLRPSEKVGVSDNDFFELTKSIVR